MPDGRIARVTVCSYNLFHSPYFTRVLGTTPAEMRAANPDSDDIKNLDNAIRSFENAAAYLPNQVFIGNLDPKELPEQPWYNIGGPAAVNGEFGDILNETALYGLIKFSDVFNLVLLSEAISTEALEILGALPVMESADLSALQKSAGIAEIEKAVEEGAFPLYCGSSLAGCVKAAHPSDENLSAHTILENLASKATAVYALRKLNRLYSGSPEDIQYIIETSEEACGDINQRGGGNFAKAIGELADLSEATGSDTRSFCAGPVHGLMQAASLVGAGTFEKVVVTAGGTTAKLAMNAKKHVAKGLPVLEDVMGSFALLIEAGDGPGLRVRNDAVGIHKIGAGAAPQAVMGNLVADPLTKAGLSFSDIDIYAPEMHNPEVTGQAGAGNVTLQNMKMIAALAVMRKEIAREGMNEFIEAHGVSGWAPTQGHIPSGVPALGWFLKWAGQGSFRRGLVIGKGSLFLGRMTNLFDGVSLLLESGGTYGRAEAPRQGKEAPASVIRKDGAVYLGCTVTGAEVPQEELEEAASAYAAGSGGRGVKVYCHDSGEKNHAAMEEDLASGEVDGVLTFHYNFPIGVATTGRVLVPGKSEGIFIATTTGTTSLDRVEALVLNAIQGKAAARAWGIKKPSVGFLNLEGAALALKVVQRLSAAGYYINLAASTRNGDGLLRGNDILKGACDVLVCDSLTGNAIMKMLGAYDTAGEVETSGAGYGCGISHGRPVGIISRATGGAVVRAALEYLERMVRNSYTAILDEEIRAAERAGLRSLIGTKTAGGGTKNNTAGLEKTPVEAEIEGIDVLSIEDAVAALTASGIYCESGMGCTGPVVMVAGANRDRAKRLLQEQSFL